MAAGTTVGIGVVITGCMEYTFFTVGVAGWQTTGGAVTAAGTATARASGKIVGDGLYLSRRQRNVIHGTHIYNSSGYSASRSAIDVGTGCAMAS